MADQRSNRQFVCFFQKALMALRYRCCLIYIFSRCTYLSIKTGNNIVHFDPAHIFRDIHRLYDLFLSQLHEYVSISGTFTWFISFHKSVISSFKENGDHWEKDHPGMKQVILWTLPCSKSEPHVRLRCKTSFPMS